MWKQRPVRTNLSLESDENGMIKFLELFFKKERANPTVTWLKEYYLGISESFTLA